MRNSRYSIQYIQTDRANKLKIHCKLNRNHLLFSQVRISPFLASDDTVEPLHRIPDIQDLRLVLHGKGTETVEDLEVQEQKRNEIRRYCQIFRGFFGGWWDLFLLLLLRRNQSLEMLTNHRYDQHTNIEHIYFTSFVRKTVIKPIYYLATTLLEREVHQRAEYSQQRQKEAQYQHQNHNVIRNFDRQHDDLSGRDVNVS